MKNIIRLTLLCFLLSCQNKQENENVGNNLKTPDTVPHQQVLELDSLFQLDININENTVKISAPKNSHFELPDSVTVSTPYKFGDFNADQKEDVLVYLGACGTGGCMYGLFLNQNANHYKLAFMDYLKNAEFKVEKDGLRTIESTEELEAYNPSKFQITVFKFDKYKNYYSIDSTYVYVKNE